MPECTALLNPLPAGDVARKTPTVRWARCYQPEKGSFSRFPITLKAQGIESPAIHITAVVVVDGEFETKSTTALGDSELSGSLKTMMTLLTTITFSSSPGSSPWTWLHLSQVGWL